MGGGILGMRVKGVQIMVKFDFPVLVHYVGVGRRVEMRAGYMDGGIFYYKDFHAPHCWRAVCPMTGLCIAKAPTRKAAARLAQYRLPDWSEHLREHGDELARRFTDAIERARVAEGGADHE